MTVIRTTGRPVLLLNIDGVINSLLQQPPSMGWPKDAWCTDVYYDAQDTGYQLLWAKPVVEYLTSLHKQDRVEVRWHTTWQDQAVEFAKIVGLPTEWAVAEAPELYASWPLFAKEQILKHQPAWWKYPAALRVIVDERRPLIWIDDDLFGKVNRTHRNGLGQIGKILMISPDPQTGLLPKHMRQVEETLAFWEEPVGAVSGP